MKDSKVLWSRQSPMVCAKVRWPATPMLSEYTFVTSRHGKVIGKVSVFIQKWIKQKGTKGKNFKNES